MQLRHNHRNGSTPRAKRSVAIPDAPPSPMNWRPSGPDDLIGQARDVCTAQVAKARRLRDARNASCKLLLYLVYSADFNFRFVGRCSVTPQF